MPAFGSTSLKRLATCHPELQLLFNEVVKSFDCVVLEGFRGQAAQEAAFAAGNTKLHYPNGKHNQQPSLAVDVVPYPIDWNDTKRFHLFAGIVIGIAFQLKIKIRWGGAWNGKLNSGNMLNDYPHFELIF